VPSIRFRLDSPTTRGLAERVRAEYGPDARVVDTEESLVGGLGGFFARRVIDVTVEIPDPAVPAGVHDFPTAERVGLARLLDDAEQEEAGLTRLEPPVSTESLDFAQVLGTLRAGVGAPPAPVAPSPVPTDARGGTPRHYEAVPLHAPFADLPSREAPAAPRTLPAAWSAVPLPAHAGVSGMRRAPELLRGPGDLILLAGLGDDSVAVANALARRAGRAYVCDGGAVGGNTRRRVEDRRTALAARAYGVQSGSPVLVAYGLGDGDPDDPRISAIKMLGPDQLWVVVDASRKIADTARWVNAVRARGDVAAMATIAGRRTSSPDSVRELGLPEGWSDRVG
jgi:hypothetical protein